MVGKLWPLLCYGFLQPLRPSGIVASPPCSVVDPHTFEQNIAAEKAKLEAQLANLKPGPEIEAIRKKIRQLDSAAHIGDWLRPIA